MSTDRHKIFVGIDYGTTFSGIAYVLPTTSNESVIQTVTSWPGNVGANNEYLEKVPSVIAYQHENTTVRNLKSDAWGYEVKPEFVSCSWTKLLLDRGSRPTKYDDINLGDSLGAGLFRLPEGKSAEDVASDYLKELYEHCMKILGKHYADFLEVTPIEFWFTMPALWSDKSQHTTRVAAQRAGFGSRPKDTIRMITEPEAGVIAAMNAQMKSVEGMLKPSTGILITDCGGGTVDLTSYVINSTEPMLRLHETCPGIGGKCGATTIDRNFQNLMHRRFGKAFDDLPISQKGPGSRFMREFEGIKKDFSNNTYQIDGLQLFMPNLDHNTVDPEIYDVNYHHVLLSREDLESCFDPVIDQILALVAQQVKATKTNKYPKIETIILVGGFGSSPYLWDKLKEWAFDHDNIRCITPSGLTSPWSAISRGAALRGLEGSKVTLKKCRLHYGTTYNRPFDSTRDNEADSTWENPKTGEAMVKRMDWHFKKNQEISPNTRKEIPFTNWYYPHKSKGSQMQLKFYSCSLFRAPEKKTSRIDQVGTILVNLNDVDLAACGNNLKDVAKKAAKKAVYWIEFIAIVTMGSDEGTMQVDVIWNSKRCGSGHFEFKQD